MSAKKMTVAGVVLVLIAGLAAFILIRNNRKTEFRDAMLSGDLSRVESLLAKHPGLANATGMDFSNHTWGRPVITDGWTPLHLAAFLGDARMVKLLIRYHARVDVKDARGLTPLLWTAFGGKEEAAAALLDGGADINARGNDGRSTIDLAKLSLDDKLIELLSQRGAKE